MRFSLNILTTFLKHFGNRKVQSGSDSTHLHNIFAPRNPRAARSRSTRLHAAKSAARLRKHRSIANAAAKNTNQPSSTAGTGTAHGAKQRGTKHRRAKMRPLTAKKPLRRCNIVIVPQPPTHPQPPGAFIVEPSFVVPGFPGLDYRHLPPFVAQKIFFDALDEGRQAIFRAEEERRESKEQAKYEHLVEQDSKKAHEARCRAEETEYARLLEEDRRKAEAARLEAENEEFARLVEEDRRKAQEAHRRAMEQEERQRQAERESVERKRRERESMERERRERERREKECREREPAQLSLVTPLRVYEEKWAALRSNAIGVEHLGFYDIPWPLFEDVKGGEDIIKERVLAFVCHPLHEHIQGGGGQAKTLRSEMLRWHPDKFEGKVLGKVVEGDREAVKEAAGRVACILTTFSAKMRSANTSGDPNFVPIRLNSSS
jgi:hypothetical protein